MNIFYFFHCTEIIFFKRIINEVKVKNMEVKINKENINDFRGIELNNIFSFSYNFDSLKYIIIELIKNQQKLNYKLIN